MIKPEFPDNEDDRLEAVKKYNLLDTLPESEFDNITSLVANICDVPVSLITLLDSDRNFLKSHHGISMSESPREISFCGHAILSEQPIFIVENANDDERFHDNPIVEDFKVSFYAGVPLINPDGFPLGTLCVYDMKPRKISDEQKESLIILAKQVVNLFDLRLKNMMLNDTLLALEERNASIQSFANKISHDLKSPLANITSLSNLFKDEIKQNHPEISLEYLNYIEESADTLRAYIDGVLTHYKSEKLLDNNKKDTTLDSIFQDIKTILTLHDNNFKLLNKATLSKTKKAALQQILLNLVDNGFKYNTNASPLVTIDYSEDKTHHVFYVKDNGIGIIEDKQATMFDLFSTAHNEDKNGNKGTGIGLYTVKSLINKMGGTIDVDSSTKTGTTFKFSVVK